MPLYNYSASKYKTFVKESAPTANDDTTLNYDIGDIWIHTGTNIYRCLDNTEGAAVWADTTLTISDLGDLASLDSVPGNLCDVDASGFSTNLDNTIDTLQKLADEVDGIPLGHLVDNDSVIFAKVGDDLRSKYNEAKALTPNGSALASDNRASLVLTPGVYDFGLLDNTTPHGLELDTEFVDVVGLNQDTVILKATKLTSEGTNASSGLLYQTADDVKIMNLTLYVDRDNDTVSNYAVAYYPATNLPNTYLKDIHFDTNSVGYSVSRTDDLIFSGTYERLTGFGGFRGDFQELNGTWIDCTMTHGFGRNSYPSTITNGKILGCRTTDDVNECFGGAIYGTLEDCIAEQGTYAFGITIYSGAVLRNCKYYGGGSAFARHIYEGALLIDCYTNNSGFGVYVNYSSSCDGILYNCIAEGVGFAGDNGSLDNAELHNCVGGEHSYASTRGDNVAVNGAKLYYCRLKSGTFALPVTDSGGYYRLCIDGNGDIDNRDAPTS